jgi:hypothetical protein
MEKMKKRKDDKNQGWKRLKRGMTMKITNGDNLKRKDD